MDRLVACAVCLIPLSRYAPAYGGRYRELFVDGETVDPRFSLDERIGLIHEALADGITVAFGDEVISSAHVTYEGVPMCLDHFARAYDA